LAAAKHQAYSERSVAPLAEHLARRALDAVPYLAAAEYEATVLAWCRAEAQVQLVDDYLRTHGVLDAKGLFAMKRGTGPAG